jgi:heme-degrading monooxygenase HmoA
MSAAGLAHTPEPPYWAVIFTSARTTTDPEGYARMGDRMVELAQQQPGFLGVESVRDAAGLGITVSYWASEEAIRAWRQHGEHRLAQEQGFAEWYAAFELRIARVERAHGFDRTRLRAEGPAPAV